MKTKISLGAISATLLAASAEAHAQSSITLYGALDESISFNSNVNGGRRYGLDDGAGGSNKWGIKGIEDLGGGMKAVFRLESGFSASRGTLSGQPPQNGTSTYLFNRQAYVGIESTQFGTTTLGRQFDAITDMVQPLTGDYWSGLSFATPGDLDNNDNYTNVNNSVKYVSPVIMGFQAEAVYSFGGVSGSTGDGRSWSAAATYNNGPASVAAGYFYAHNSQGTWTNATAQPAFGSSLGYNQNNFKSAGIASVAGQYQFDSLTAGLRYSNTQFQGINGKSIHFHVVSSLMQYQATAALSFGAEYTYVNGSAATPEEALKGHTMAAISQYSLGTQYALSKRTLLFALGAYVHAHGASASAADTGYTSSNGDQFQADFGIHHTF